MLCTIKSLLKIGNNPSLSFHVCFALPFLCLPCLFIPQRLHPFAAAFTRKPHGVFSQIPRPYKCRQTKKNPRPLKKGFHYLFFYGRGLKNRARNPIIDVLIAYYRFLAARVLADACGIPLEKLQNGFSRISRRMIYLGNPSRRQFPLSSCRYTSAFA